MGVAGPRWSTIEQPSALDPRAPAAERIAELWWILLAIGTLAFAIVAGLLLIVAVRGRRARRDAGLGEVPGSVPDRVANRWIVSGGVVLPAVLLTAALALSVTTMQRLPREVPAGGLVIQVVGYQWWWSVHYPGEHVTVANEIHIPVGERVELQLRSADVIHSFWVPQLHGKLDLTPDDTNRLVIEAREEGTFRGACAEFCGLQHAKMGLLVVAHSPDAFASWLAAQRLPAAEPADDVARRGRDVFAENACARCHTIRGVTDTAPNAGPDLTHLASRREILAGTAANAAAELFTWLHDPAVLKEGTAMPSFDLSDADLRALVTYLENLE